MHPMARYAYLRSVGTGRHAAQVVRTYVVHPFDWLKGERVGLQLYCPAHQAATYRTYTVKVLERIMITLQCEVPPIEIRIEFPYPPHHSKALLLDSVVAPLCIIQFLAGVGNGLEPLTLILHQDSSQTLARSVCA